MTTETEQKKLNEQLDTERKERSEQDLFTMEVNQSFIADIIEIIPSNVGGSLIRLKLEDTADPVLMGVAMTLDSAIKRKEIVIGDKVFIKRYADRVGAKSGRTYGDFDIMRV